MKKIVALGLLLSWVSALATVVSAHADEAKLVKTCSTTLGIPGISMTIPTTIEIFLKGDIASAKVTQIVDGQASFYTDPAQIADYSVRADLISNSAQYDNDANHQLNFGESLILETYEFLQDPDLGQLFATGVDLAQIRSAKLYMVGEKGPLSNTILVESFDADHKYLGTFITGFLPFACEK